MPRFILTATFAAIALFALFVSTAVHADAIVSNFDQTINGSGSVGLFFGGPITRGGAFTTGANPDGYTLNSVSLRMGAGSGVPAGFVVTLHSDSSGLPGTLISALTGNSNPFADGDYAYTAASVSLSPTTTYFVVADADDVSTPTNSNNFRWRVTDSGSDASVDGWSIADGHAQSFNNGGGWSSTTGALFMSIDATPVSVPEPTSLALLGLAGAGAMLRRRGGRVARRHVPINACQ